MTNHDKKNETVLPGTANDEHDAGKTSGDNSHDKRVKPETATPEAPKKDPEAKPAITQPTHKNG